MRSLLYSLRADGSLDARFSKRSLRKCIATTTFYENAGRWPPTICDHRLLRRRESEKRPPLEGALHAGAAINSKNCCGHMLRREIGAQALIRRINAAVLGLLAAALYKPLWTSSVNSSIAFAIALCGFALLSAWRTPPLIVVILGAMAGAAY